PSPQSNIGMFVRQIFCARFRTSAMVLERPNRTCSGGTRFSLSPFPFFLAVCSAIVVARLWVHIRAQTADMARWPNSTLAKTKPFLFKMIGFKCQAGTTTNDTSQLTVSFPERELPAQRRE